MRVGFFGKLVAYVGGHYEVLLWEWESVKRTIVQLECAGQSAAGTSRRRILRAPAIFRSQPTDLGGLSEGGFGGLEILAEILPQNR